MRKTIERVPAHTGPPARPVPLKLVKGILQKCRKIEALEKAAVAATRAYMKEAIPSGWDGRSRGLGAIQQALGCTDDQLADAIANAVNASPFALEMIGSGVVSVLLTGPLVVRVTKPPRRKR